MDILKPDILKTLFGLREGMAQPAPKAAAKAAPLKAAPKAAPKKAAPKKAALVSRGLILTSLLPLLYFAIVLALAVWAFVRSYACNRGLGVPLMRRIILAFVAGLNGSLYHAVHNGPGSCPVGY